MNYLGWVALKNTLVQDDLLVCVATGEVTSNDLFTLLLRLNFRNTKYKNIQGIIPCTLNHLMEASFIGRYQEVQF